MGAHYWVRVDGDGYFVRFQTHNPPRVFTNRRRDRSYCFASEEDARRVADQLKRYGRHATVVTERAAPPPPPPITPRSIEPPERLREWVYRIFEAGRTNPSSTTDRAKVGYRILARKCHPDMGGSTADMQALSDAIAWLRQNDSAGAKWFEELSDTRWSDF